MGGGGVVALYYTNAEVAELPLNRNVVNGSLGHILKNIEVMNADTLSILLQYGANPSDILNK